MKKTVLNTAILAAMSGLSLISGQAFAHVGYGSALYSGAGVADPVNGGVGTGTLGAPANFSATVSSNGGYLAGLSANNGNTHDNRFRYFTLAHESLVSFTINGLTNSAVTGNANPALNGITPSTLNPGFSLFSGTVPAASHDGVGDTALNADGTFNQAGYDALSPAVKSFLASEPGFASWSPFAKLNTVIDHAKGLAEGTTAAAVGTGGQWGSYITNGTWGTGNNTGQANTISPVGIYGADAASGSGILGADGLVDNKVSWSGILGPGVYSLVIGGANASDYATLFADAQASNSGLGANLALNNAYAADRLARSLSITGFSVTAVPVPAAFWLLSSALAGMGAIGRRHKAAA